MRLRTMVVGCALTATLALVALPGLAGSRAPRPIEPSPVGALQPLAVPADPSRSDSQVDGLDAAHIADGAVSADDSFIEPGHPPKTAKKHRASVDQPDGSSRSVRKPAKYTLKGTATFYDEGTTAMRVPRGTTVIICGGAGCVERVINDYGPQSTSRIADLDKQDFFKICGCPSYSGTTTVTIYVY
jgi:hypothetical protein